MALLCVPPILLVRAETQSAQVQGRGDSPFTGENYQTFFFFFFFKSPTSEICRSLPGIRSWCIWVHGITFTFHDVTKAWEQGKKHVF